MTQASGAYTYTFGYAYDKVGNRTAMTKTITSTLVTTYTYDAANRLATQNGQSLFTWDANGNLLSDGSTTYAYDFANRLISTTLSSVNTQFAYNGDGIRLRLIEAGTLTTYTQDYAAPLPVVLQAKTGANARQYVYSMGTRPLAEYEAAAWEYLLADPLGSVRQIADESGGVTLLKSYAPYGAVLNNQGSATSDFGYAGEQMDAYIKLVFLRARYYSPDTARFLSKDTWQGDYSRPQSFNAWSYVENDPVNATDPSGWRRIRIWASAFIPEAKKIFPYRWFPSPDLLAEWHGDNRSFAWGDNTRVFNTMFSARVWHEIVLETDPTISFYPAIYNAADTGRTIVDYSVSGSLRQDSDKAPAPKKATVSRDAGQCIIRVGFTVSAPEGSNPLEMHHWPPPPPIDYVYYLQFDLSKDELLITGYYDKYPAHELYITGDTGLALAPVQSMPFGFTRSPLDLASWPAFIEPTTLKLWPGEDGPCDCQ